MTASLSLLLISHVHPFPGASGQEQRVKNMLLGLRKRFRTTFLTVGDRAEVTSGAKDLCDEAIVLPRRYKTCRLSRVAFKAIGAAFAAVTGLKESNFAIDKVELAPPRVLRALGGRKFDCVVIEYWHAISLAKALRRQRFICVLDMHDILWRSYERQLEAQNVQPKWLRNWRLARYRAAEEKAWTCFDGIIAINHEEHDHVVCRVSRETPVFNTPMGIDMSHWPYLWQPVQPPRIGFYGGLGSAQNQQMALRCVSSIMPAVWKKRPDVQLWLVGSNPPQHIAALHNDPRIKVTGFVRDVSDVLRTMTALLCPWSGTYGFRSRIVEAMALGVPVVTSSEGIWGMELTHEAGIMVCSQDHQIAQAVLRLLEDQQYCRKQSRKARESVVDRYDFENTYGRLSSDLHAWLSARSIASL